MSGDRLAHIRRATEKHPCSRCGEPCFRIAYVGYRLVCASCFQAVALARLDSGAAEENT